jgi:aryl-alcohol dehydrogenase-like predicted oxidoreductase
VRVLRQLGRQPRPTSRAGLGGVGDGTTAADRRSIYAELADGGWRFVDHAAPGAPASQEETLGRGLRGSDVERDPQREEVVETLEFIVRNDARLPRLGVSSRLS